MEEYIHRISRTRQVGNIAEATSFFNVKTDSGQARSLQEVPNFLRIGAAKNEVNLIGNHSRFEHSLGVMHHKLEFKQKLPHAFVIS